MIPRRYRAWTRNTPVILLVLVAGACRKKPAVIGIEVVPAEVTVGSDPAPTTFQLEARLWGGTPAQRWSIVESDGYKNLHWKVEPAGTAWLQVAPNGFRATITISGNAAPPGPGFITIKAGGKETDPGAKITVVPSGISGQDAVRASYTAGQTPDVAIVNGVRAGESACRLSFFAFVRWLPVGALSRPCSGTEGAWGAAVLAQDHGSMFVPVAWTINDNVVDGAAPQGSVRTIPIALRIMVAPNELAAATIAEVQSEALAFALEDLEVANSMLAENRVGIQLAIADTRVVNVLAPTVVADCKTGDDQSSSEDLAGVLNVYYVNRMGSLRGLTCTRVEGRKQDVIYLAWEDHPHSTVTLVHELGHALGLLLPGAGHTDMVAGLDGSNLMATGDDDNDPAGRRRFTVGQAFRMNAESASWLNLATDPHDPTVPIREISAARVACQCGERDPGGSCPRVADDVAPQSEESSAAGPWSCSDEVRLSPRTTSGAEGSIPPDENPAAIAAGRMWRAPETCQPDIKGTSSRRGTGTYIEIPNLTRPGTCASWIAVFFGNGGVVHRFLAEPDALWNPSADLLSLRYPVAPLVDVKVHVHTPPNDWNTDAENAVKIFGPTNRSGLSLSFDQVTSCPATNTSASDIYVCYTTGTGEGTASPNGIVKVVTLNRKETTVPYLIGRALGLPDADPTDEAFDENIMQADPADRGPRLTLGQVYRASRRINTSLPGCDPGPCPSLNADVR